MFALIDRLIEINGKQSHFLLSSQHGLYHYTVGTYMYTYDTYLVEIPIKAVRLHSDNYNIITNVICIIIIFTWIFFFFLHIVYVT